MERDVLLFPFWIDMAVPIFMILSGYVYTKSFDKQGITTFEDAYRLKKVITKIVRFMVPFSIIYILELCVTSLNGDHYSLKQIYNGFLCGGFGPGSYYVPLMIQFIFVFPVIYFIIRKYEIKGLILCGFINGVYEIMQSAYGMNEGCYRLLLFRYILVIAFGCYLALEKETKIKNRYYVLSFIVGVMFILLCCYTNYTPKIIVRWTRTSFVACLYILPIAALLMKRKMKCWILEQLGQASYNIFLVQMAYYFKGADIVYGLVEHRWTELIINFIICCVGGLVFYYIEKPITKWIIRKIDTKHFALDGRRGDRT